MVEVEPRRGGWAFTRYMPDLPPDRRLSEVAALSAAANLEGQGWRAEDVYLIGGLALVEVRDCHQRPHPVVAILRTPEDVDAFWHAVVPTKKPRPPRKTGVRVIARALGVSPFTVSQALHGKGNGPGAQRVRAYVASLDGGEHGRTDAPGAPG